MNKGMLYMDGKPLCEIKNLTCTTIKKVIVWERIRRGIKSDFKERSYYCPNCDELLARHNGVVWIYGNPKRKKCKKCGYKLIWE